MRRHWEFRDGQTYSEQYKKGDQSSLNDMTDVYAQLEYEPDTTDPSTWRLPNRPEYTNPLIATWDTK